MRFGFLGIGLIRLLRQALGLSANRTVGSPESESQPEIVSRWFGRNGRTSGCGAPRCGKRACLQWHPPLIRWTAGWSAKLWRILWSR